MKSTKQLIQNIDNLVLSVKKEYVTVLSAAQAITYILNRYPTNEEVVEYGRQARKDLLCLL